MRMFSSLWGVLLCCLAVSACQKAPSIPGNADLRIAEQATPDAPQLAQKYARACQACHSSRASTAPLTGFVPDWQLRLQQGVPTLVAHAREGYKAMPARGYCNDCSDQDLESLIVFMSSTQRAKE